MPRFVSATLVGSPVFEAGGAWLPIVINLKERSERRGVYLRPDPCRRVIADLDSFSLSTRESRKLNRELLIELDCDLAERTEYCFYLAGGVFNGRRLTPESEGQAYEEKVREIRRSLGIATFFVPKAARIGIATFREPPAREALRELAAALFGNPYFNVFESRNMHWPRLIRGEFGK